MGWNRPKVSSSTTSGSGAYNNFQKTAGDAKANPKNYSMASSSISRALDDLGLPNSWMQATLELVARESSFNPNAKNPKSTAKGLFQFLDSTRKNYGGSKVDWNDPYQQSLAGLKYIKDRYGDPEKALRFWDKNNYY